jgi:uncharacterized protein DUF3147
VIKAIKFDMSMLAQGRWQEYALRFVAGGAITAAAGLIAKEFGPGIGGLFLAFPAIFPASATLVEKHERERKEEEGVQGAERGRQAASLDAAGAAMGSLGLLVFALLVWKLLPVLTAWIVLPLATIVWLGVSMMVWVLRKKY